jgi:hypothetical protein
MEIAVKWQRGRGSVLGRGRECFSVSQLTFQSGIADHGSYREFFLREHSGRSVKLISHIS